MKKQLLIGLLAISTFSTAVATNITPSQRLNNQLQQITDNYLKTAQEQKTGVTAIEVSVLLPNEKNPRDFAAGLQQKNGAPATTDMMAQYGSITKASTASLVLKLVNEGKIKLSTTLYDIFPDKFNYHQWPEAWKQATVEQILNMTSGITNYLESEITKSLKMYGYYSKEQIVNIAAEYQKTKGCKAEYACFPAGSSYGYSNTGYIIAGLIVEKYTHRDFQDEIYKTILEPLKQKTGANVHYVMRYDQTVLSKMIHGYAKGYNTFNPILQDGSDVTMLPLYLMSSAGGYTGNTHSLALMTHAFFNTGFFPGHKQSLTTGIVNIYTGQPVKDIAFECDISKTENCYGLGFEVTHMKPYGTVFYTSGGTFGYLTQGLILEDGIVIATSQNSSKAVNFDYIKPIYEVVMSYLSRIDK